MNEEPTIDPADVLEGHERQRSSESAGALHLPGVDRCFRCGCGPDEEGRSPDLNDIGLCDGCAAWIDGHGPDPIEGHTFRTGIGIGIRPHELVEKLPRRVAFNAAIVAVLGVEIGWLATWDGWAPIGAVLPGAVIVCIVWQTWRLVALTTTLPPVLNLYLNGRDGDPEPLEWGLAPDSLVIDDEAAPEPPEVPS